MGKIESDFEYRLRLMARMNETGDQKFAWEIGVATGEELDAVGHYFELKRGKMMSDQEKTVEAPFTGASSIKRPDEALHDLGELFRSRNAVYGSTYKDFGRVMLALIPGETVLRTEQDWNRIGLFFHCADKLARYGRQFRNGGHHDSLDDNSVYSQMLQEYDAECRAKVDPEFMEVDEVKFYVGGGSVWAEDGQLYWVQAARGCLPFIAEYQLKSRDRNSHEAGPAWWTMDHREVITTDDFRVVSWVQRPNLKE